MNLKTLGYTLIVLALLFLGTILIFKMQIDSLVEAQMISMGGECIVDGKCLHEQSNTPMYFGIAGVLALFFSGVYLSLYERSQRHLQAQHEQIVQRLEETKKQTEVDERFQTLLRALDEDEQKVLKAIREQDGITQATLRIRIDMSKTKLSLVLKGLEQKKLVKRLAEGKTNKVYLKLPI